MIKFTLSKYFRAGFIVLPLFILTGCATYGGTNYGVTMIKSIPEGVHVLDMEDGSVIGITPVKYLWHSKDTSRKFMNVRLHKEGYKDAIKSFWLSLEHGSKKAAFANPQLVEFELIKITP